MTDGDINVRVPGVGYSIQECNMLVTVTLAVLVLQGRPALGTQDVMKDVTLGFGEALQHCRQESQLTEEMMEEFFHFWNEDFKFQHRELGCALRCMGRHFDLLTSEHRVHHDRTDAFIKSFPNGEVLAGQMMTIISECEHQFEHEEDHCWRILHVAECFKTACQQRQLAPSMQMLMAELIMEAETD